MTNNEFTILLVDDEKSIRETLKMLLTDNGYKVVLATDGFEALDVLKNQFIDILITDLRMSKMDGIELMERALKTDPYLGVIFISAYADIKCAVSAIKLGAFDYMQKSFTNDEFLITVENAVKRKKLLEENRHLKRKLENNYGFGQVIGKSDKMQLIFSMIDRIAQSKATVLLSGESGVGKEVFAKLIHERSKRKDKNFVVINCGAIPENLIESELFGHEKGAFTGANQTKIGKFEQADQGTVFLDEVGELPLSMQVKFLRILQEKEFQRVGSLESIKTDIRIIAATNKNLMQEVKNGNFREDIYYRLNVINFEIPPLRKRKEDIPLLAEHFLESFTTEYNKDLKIIEIEALSVLVNYPWLGNVRELKNAIERAVVVAEKNEEILTKNHIPKEILGEDNDIQYTANEKMTLKEFEKIFITNTLKQTNGNKTKTAEILGVKRQTLYNKIKEYEIKI